MEERMVARNLGELVELLQRALAEFGPETKWWGYDDESLNLKSADGNECEIFPEGTTRI